MKAILRLLWEFYKFPFELFKFVMFLFDDDFYDVYELNTKNYFIISLWSFACWWMLFSVTSAIYSPFLFLKGLSYEFSFRDFVAIYGAFMWVIILFYTGSALVKKFSKNKIDY